MPRKLPVREPIDLLAQLELPMLQPQLVPMMSQFGGVDYATAITKLGDDKAAYIQNISLTDGGSMQCRHGTQEVGTDAASTVLAAIVFRSATGGEYIVRVTRTSLDVYSGGVWTTCTGVTLALNTYVIPSFTTWNDDLIMATDTGMYQVNMSLFTISLIPDAPACRQVTTFGGRLVASGVFSSSTEYNRRVQWCVKNNNTDWSGLGSGYEDLLSAPGGAVDMQFGCFPINDREALVIRSNSVWIAVLTGNFDAPFEFSFLYGNVPCDSPATIATIPGGVIYTMRDNVVIATTAGPTYIGLPVRSQLAEIPSTRMVGTYDSHKNEYLLCYGAQIVWKYSLSYKVWMMDLYSLSVKYICASVYQPRLSVDELTGTVDSLTGPVDSLGMDEVSPTIVMVSETTPEVFRTIEGLTTDHGILGATAIAVQLDTGYLPYPTDLHALEIHAIHMTVINPVEDSLVTLLYNTGNGWTFYSSFNPTIGDEPETYRVRKNLWSKKLRLRLSISDAGGMTILDWFREVTPGYKVNP